MIPMIFLLEAGYLPPGRLFGLDVQTILSAGIMMFSVALLCVILTYLLYEPVRTFMRNRADGIRNQFSSAAENMATAEALKAEYEQKLQSIEAERAKILTDARRLAQERANQILVEATEEAEGVKARAFREVAAERVRVKDEVTQAIVDISTDMAARLVKISIDERAEQALFTEALAALDVAMFQSSGGDHTTSWQT